MRRVVSLWLRFWPTDRQLQDGDARETYDGGFEIDGEVGDPCLARLWPEFALLRAAGGWPEVAQALYGPLVSWFVVP